jgi:TetR/AcrR family transcriptional regulator, mexJK operon transcriptional repressor
MKRAAILQAARELFLTDGYDRASVDAIAARASVSKRTLYDYFGDKRTLFIAVVDEVVSSLLDSVRRAIADNLIDVSDIQAALVGFSSQVTLSTLGSSDYSDLMRLLTPGLDALTLDLEKRWESSTPEDLLIAKFTELGAQGLLDVPDVPLAVDHFVALTLHPAVNAMRRPGPTEVASAQQSIADGVAAFLRAYGPGRN